MLYDAFFSWKPLLLTRIVGLGSLALPVFIFFLKTGNEKHKQVVSLTLYTLVILYLTVLGRNYSEIEKISFTPFWSYAHFSEYGVRYQIYMNIFLFTPFGFLLSWAKKWNMTKVVLAGCLFSILIEVTQYFFRLGLCEFDDVFHNTIGTALGYWYWRGLEHFLKKKK